MAADRSAQGAQALGIPQRKISETIIDFGAPLIADLDPGQPLEIVRSVFAIVITVWNAHVMAMPVWGRPQLLQQLGELVQAPGSAPQLTDTCAQLAARRQAHFAQDPRAVGEWSVTIDPQGRMRLHCEARVPPALTP